MQICDNGRAKGDPFLIMEFMERSSLLDRRSECAIPLEKAINLAVSMNDGGRMRFA
jgi:hypothetical protein